MRELSFIEQATVSGATYTKIQPNSRFFTNEDGIDARYELIMYISDVYGDIPLVGALPARFVDDMAELFYRSVSYEDTFWRSAYWGCVGLLAIGSSFGAGYMSAKMF
ncbi:MAG: hypothetical protein U1E78_06615 [Gammaproteobacteria bacterium]